MDPCLRRFQLARKFPDIGQVRVDRMGNIIGGVNPFEGTNVKLEDQPDPEDQEVSVKSANRALNLNYCSCTFTRSSTQDRALEAQTCNFGPPPQHVHQQHPCFGGTILMWYRYEVKVG